MGRRKRDRVGVDIHSAGEARDLWCIGERDRAAAAAIQINAAKAERPVRCIGDVEAWTATERPHLAIAGAQDLASELNGAAAGLNIINVNRIGMDIDIPREGGGGNASCGGQTGGNAGIERRLHGEAQFRHSTLNQSVDIKIAGIDTDGTTGND